jgi:hypothetical protein
VREGRIKAKSPFVAAWKMAWFCLLEVSFPNDRNNTQLQLCKVCDKSKAVKSYAVARFRDLFVKTSTSKHAEMITCTKLLRMFT